MNKGFWKGLAIILFVILLSIAAFSAYIYHKVNLDEKNTQLCYYDVCEQYEDAAYKDNVCFCYTKSLLGDLVVAKTEVMK